MQGTEKKHKNIVSTLSQIKILFARKQKIKRMLRTIPSGSLHLQVCKQKILTFFNKETKKQT